MDLSAFHQLYDALPDADKKKFVIEGMKWLLEAGWKKLTSKEKKESAVEVSRLVQV